MAAPHVTQADIARHAGVSQSAVSQVLAGRGTDVVSPETSARICEVARQLGYRRASSRKSMAKKTKNVGFLIPEGFDADHLQVYIRRLYAGVLRQLESRGYNLVQSILHPEESLPGLVRERKVDGVIIEDRCEAALVRRIQAHMPVMLLNFDRDLLDVDSVMPDNAGGIWQVMQHLYGLGHRRIAVFGMEPAQLHHAERLQAYRKSLCLLGLTPDERYINVREPQHYRDSAEVDEFAYNTLQRWRALVAPPTAVIALTDGYASVLLRAAHQLDIAIPQQLSMVGFDNLPLCEYTDPRLASIDQPMEAMGEAACRTLLARIAGDDGPTQKLRLGVKFISRESIAPIAAV